MVCYIVNMLDIIICHGYYCNILLECLDDRYIHCTRYMLIEIWIVVGVEHLCPSPTYYPTLQCEYTEKETCYDWSIWLLIWVHDFTSVAICFQMQTLDMNILKQKTIIFGRGRGFNFFSHPFTNIIHDSYVSSSTLWIIFSTGSQWNLNRFGMTCYFY